MPESIELSNQARNLEQAVLGGLMLETERYHRSPHNKPPRLKIWV
jgi:hypothetical protein